MTMKKNVLTLLFLLSCGIVFAQETITGTIKDEQGQPLPGATILLKGTSTYAVTDIEGFFSITGGKELPFTLQVNFVGYQTQEIEIYEIAAEPTEVILKLEGVLNEVVVVGY